MSKQDIFPLRITLDQNVSELKVCFIFDNQKVGNHVMQSFKYLLDHNSLDNYGWINRILMTEKYYC